MENYINIFCALKYFYDVKEIKNVDLFEYFSTYENDCMHILFRNVHTPWYLVHDKNVLYLQNISITAISTVCKYLYVIRIFHPSSCFIVHCVWIRNMKSFFWTLLHRQQWGKWFNNEKIILLRCNVTSTKNLIDQCLGEMMQYSRAAKSLILWLIVWFTIDVSHHVTYNKLYFFTLVILMKIVKNGGKE